MKCKIDWLWVKVGVEVLNLRWMDSGGGMRPWGYVVGGGVKWRGKHTNEWGSKRTGRWWRQRELIQTREGGLELNLNWRTNWLTVAAMLISINVIFNFFFLFFFGTRSGKWK